MPLGLTHPTVNDKWFGCYVGDWFFRLVDGDRYIAVLRTPASAQLVDSIPVEADTSSDPRPVLWRLAEAWAMNHSRVRR